MKRFFSSTFFKVIVYLFAAIGAVFTFVFVGMQFGLFNVRGSNAARNSSLAIPVIQPVHDCTTSAVTCNWNATVEWVTLASAFTKDASVIDEVSQEVGISPRMLVATVMPEQVRYFTANRESFKKYFEPLKILSSLSRFS
ncbi:MAG TPA: hypothetical protein VG621_00830, partial [Candidatus Paceibacterota bacterium]|nr:hypothetical protein [Candidatus Paceibacterota bacterium]